MPLFWHKDTCQTSTEVLCLCAVAQPARQRHFKANIFRRRCEGLSYPHLGVRLLRMDLIHAKQLRQQRLSRGTALSSRQPSKGEKAAKFSSQQAANESLLTHRQRNDWTCSQNFNLNNLAVLQNSKEGLGCGLDLQVQVSLQGKCSGNFTRCSHRYA